MKMSSTTRHSVASPKYTQLLNIWKFSSSTRLLTTASSRALPHSKPATRAKVPTSRSRDSSQPTNLRPRTTINVSKPQSTTATPPALSPRDKPGPTVNSNGSVLKKYTKELFRRYDDRTSELSVEVRSKGELQLKIETLIQRVKALELENAEKDRVIEELVETKKARSRVGQRVQTHMDELRAKLTKLVRERKCN